MNTRDEQFFKELGTRIAQARKDQGLTQQQLASTLGVAQQTLAHYEVGRARLPVSMLPALARLLAVSIDTLMGLSDGTAAESQRDGHRRAPLRLQQQIAALAQLPRSKQQFVSEMLESVLGQAVR